MFVGHLALGFAAKRTLPTLSLAVLLSAVQLADLMWPVFVALGVEQVAIDPGNTVFTPFDFISYPYSHSLVLLIVWGVLFGWLFRTRPDDRRSIVILAALVVSHWVLDFVTHRPDMPLYPGSAKFGLGLWNSRGATLAIELTMFAAGLWIYTSATRPRDAIGRWGLVALVAILTLAYFGAAFGGPPPSVTAVWIGGLAGGTLGTILSWWVDRHREA